MATRIIEIDRYIFPIELDQETAAQEDQKNTHKEIAQEI